MISVLQAFRDFFLPRKIVFTIVTVFVFLTLGLNSFADEKADGIVSKEYYYASAGFSLPSSELPEVNLHDIIAKKAADGKIILPIGIVRVRNRITINRPLLLQGHNTVCLIEGNGKIVIDIPSKKTLHIKNLTVVWRKKVGSHEIPLSAFVLRRGGLVITNSKIYCQVQNKNTDWSRRVDILFIQSPETNEYRSLILNDNLFVNKYLYSVYLLKVWAGKNVTLTNNKIYLFHNAITLFDVCGAKLEGNEFYKNSLNSIVISGKNVVIKHNRVFFHGNGTNGDGIISYNVYDLNIDGNVIWGGSCYGVSILAKAQKIKFVNNLIGGGITTALYIVPSLGTIQSSTRKQDMFIEHNIFANNIGYGVFVRDADNVYIVNNFFSGRGKAFRCVSCDQVFLKDNFKITPYELQKRPLRKPYDSMFVPMSDKKGK